MTTLFRIVLIVVSVGTFGIVMQKIRQARMRIEDAVFWVLLCIMFVLFALFPGIPDLLAHLLGIYSTANFLFLFMIFILVLKVFSLSMHISSLETKLRELVQEEALSELRQKEALKACGCGAEQEKKTAENSISEEKHRKDGRD